jgi:putative endonuclease
MCNGMFYVGQSHDVAKRIRRHADGSGSRQAKQLKEFILVYVEGPIAPDAALKRERQLKKWSRAKKMALIHGDLETLKSLSKSRETRI